MVETPKEGFSSPPGERFGIAVGACVALALSSLCGCYGPSVPRELFVLDASRSRVPVMLSRVQDSQAGGRPIHAEAHASRSESRHSTGSYVFGGTQVTFYEISREHSESAAPVSRQLLDHVDARDRWVRIVRVTYRALDETTLVSRSSSREVIVEGRAHP
jgi:hypothetical protein